MSIFTGVKQRLTKRKRSILGFAEKQMKKHETSLEAALDENKHVLIRSRICFHPSRRGRVIEKRRILSTQ